LTRRVTLSTSAAKDYRNLDPQIRKRIDEELSVLAIEPFSPAHSKVLVNQGGTRAGRVGDWRILFVANEETLNVIRIRHRREVYKNL